MKNEKKVTANNLIIEDNTFPIGETTTSTFALSYEKKVESVQFIENKEGNFMEITYSITPNFNIYTSFNLTSGHKSMIKERYGVVKGKMQLIKTISGKENPGYYVPPNIEWEE
jgi:hypothetical protein